jgi:hypothetical protein
MIGILWHPSSSTDHGHDAEPDRLGPLLQDDFQSREEARE